MYEDTVVLFSHPDRISIEDPLTQVLRLGARRLLADAVEAEVEAFIAAPEWASAGVAARARSPASRIAFMVVPLSDAVGPLEFPDIGHDPGHIAAGQPLDRRHVPETPVMGPDAPCDRPLKRFVAVMAGLVNDMDQRRCDPFLSGRVPAMA